MPTATSRSFFDVEIPSSYRYVLNCQRQYPQSQLLFVRPSSSLLVTGSGSDTPTVKFPRPSSSSQPPPSSVRHCRPAFIACSSVFVVIVVVIGARRSALTFVGLSSLLAVRGGPSCGRPPEDAPSLAKLTANRARDDAGDGLLRRRQRALSGHGSLLLGGDGGPLAPAGRGAGQQSPGGLRDRVSSRALWESSSWSSVRALVALA